MATEKQAKDGFEAQTRVCKILSEKLKKSSYKVVETDMLTDLNEHYDIRSV